jgi:hypothetical protein
MIVGKSAKSRFIGLNRSRFRGNKGITTVALVLVVAMGVIMPLGILGFEIVRFTVMQEELHNITDSSALAGTAAMAGAPAPPAINAQTGQAWTYADRQYQAMCVAAQTFAQNSILQTGFSLNPIPASSDGTSVVPIPAFTAPYNVFLGGGILNPTPPTNQSPDLYTAVLNIVLLDTNNNQVATGTQASTIQVQAYYSDQPVFLGLVQNWGMPSLGANAKYTVSAISNGALPSVDIMLCFDTSGSMDDQTQVRFYNRFWYWDTASSNGYVQYNCLNAWGTPGVGPTIATTLGAPTVGTQVNVYPPQNLASASFPAIFDANGNQTGGNQYPFCFTETSSTSGANPNYQLLNGLRTGNLNTLNQEAKNVTSSNATQVNNAANFTFNNYTSSMPGLPEAGLPPGNYNYEDPAHWRYSPATAASLDSFGNKWANGKDPTLGNGWNTALAYPNPLYVTPGPADPTPFNNAFTDMVPYWNFAGWGPLGITVNGTTYVWYNEYQLIESSRGNCESAAILSQAQGGPQWGWGGAGSSVKYAPINRFNHAPDNQFTPAAGYFAAYWLWVLCHATPMNTAITAAHDFFLTMDISADSHFGLEAFSGTAASLTPPANPTEQVVGSGQTEVLAPLAAIDPKYFPGGGNTPYYMPMNPPNANVSATGPDGTLPLPCIPLNSTSGQDNFNLITSSFLTEPAAPLSSPLPANPYAALPNNMPLTPSLGTNIADALNQALSIVGSTTYTRATAQKVMILFTDGVPWEPGGTQDAAKSAAFAVATRAGQANPPVPIYTIGLSQNPNILPLEANLLGDGQTYQGVKNPPGIAYLSSPGTAKYYSVQDPTNLEDAFQQIARSLCVLR